MEIKTNDTVKMQRLKAILIVVTARFSAAISTILYKLAQDDGMHMWVLLTYRYLIASIIIFPLALFLERNKRPKLTWTLFFQALLCAFLMGPVPQYMYTQSLFHTSTTFVAAISNLTPPFTFIVAVLFRLEKFEIGKITGKAKVIGTIVGVGGAMILTFYEGHQLNIKSIHLNLFGGGQHMDGQVATRKITSRDHIFGFIFALAYCLFIALYFNLQSKLSVNYPFHYSSAFFYNCIGFIQSLVYGNISEISWSQWKLRSKIRLFSAIVQGICVALSVFLILPAIHLQGPLFVSSFNPLGLIYVMIISFLVLEEKLRVGSLLGSVIIIVGLYLVLWAKAKETKRLSKLTPSKSSKDVNVAQNVISTIPTLETVSTTHTSFLVDVDEGDELPTISPREKHEEEIVEEV